LQSIVDEKGQYKTFSYYQDDTIKSVNYPVATVPTPAVTYTYDPNYTRLVSMQDGMGTTEYTYNPVTIPPTLGATQRASINGPFSNSLLTFQYDQLGRVVSRAINGVAQAFTFDALGRPVIETNDLGTFQYSYFGATPGLASEVYPNGQSNSYAYYGNTGDERVRQIQHFKPGGVPLSAFGYSYNAVGDITIWTNQWDTLPTAVRLPSYDAADQLTSVSSSGGPSTVSNYTYAYDATGNRLLAATNGFQNNYYYNVLNQLMSGGPGPTNATYQWDAENRLAAVNEGLDTSDFSYDGFGRRCEILEKTNGVVATNNYFLWCDDEICEMRGPTGASVVKRFFPQGEMVLGAAGNTNYYYTRDHLGSVREALNSSGTLVTRYDYDPYGQMSALEEGYKTTFGFDGDFVHQKSGLNLTWFRAYDSGRGRWLSRDPISNPWLIIVASPGPSGLGQFLPAGFFGAGGTQTLANSSGNNLYEFSLDNPVNLADPLGLFTFGVGLSVNGQWGPINVNWSGGLVFDNHGGVGIYNAPGAGVGVGAGVSGGISFSASNAQGICDLAGPFSNFSVGAGAGLSGSIEGFQGPSDHGTVTGGGFTIGPGLGAGGSAGGSYTWVTPIR
jgi:RHS repeat-associated protein